MTTASRADDSKFNAGTLSRRTWSDIKAGIHHLDQGQAGGEFELEELVELLEEP